MHNKARFSKIMLHSNSLFFFFFFFVVVSLSAAASSSYISADFNPLQSFKSSSDPAGHLRSWDSAVDPCSGSWLGVSCHKGRVTRLVLEGLRLNGTIRALSLLSRLRVLSLKNNTLSGSLHLLDLSLWQPHLKLLYLSGNRFSGPLPRCVLLLRHLHRLDLAGNRFSGTIPADIGVLLPKLLTLRLEDNLLGGEIPGSLGGIRGLAELNVSYNRLVGEVPGSLSSLPASSFAGNAGLCGKPLPGAACPRQAAPVPGSRTRKKKSLTATLILVAALAVAALATLAAALLIVLKRVRRRRGEGKGGRGGRGDDSVKASKEERLVFFEGCREFVMEDLMRGSAEMLGRGAVGSTYRVAMEGGDEAAGVVVKRVRKERAGKERREWAEAEGLLAEIGGWRHPNVASLLAYYSSEDELLLVFQYVPRGSLHNLLHGNRGPGRTPLDWPQRFKLALGAARGLSFLHGASKSKLSHQHLTSSNILVDEQGNALISDFALHQLLAPPPLGSAKNPPECDVYGLGLVLLELLTGRTQGEGEMELARWVRTVVREEWTAEVFDFELLRCKEAEDEMVALLQVALLCLAPDPGHRPKARVVEKMVEDVTVRGGGGGRGSSLSPSVHDNTSYESSPGLSDDYTAAFASS